MLTKTTNLLVAIQPHCGPVQVWMTTVGEVIHDATQYDTHPLHLYDRQDYDTLKEMLQEYLDDGDTPPDCLVETLAHFNHLADDGTLPPEVTGPVVMVEPKHNHAVTLNPSVEQQLDAALDVFNDWQHYRYAYDQATFEDLLALYPHAKGMGWYVGATEPEEKGDNADA